MANTSSRTLRLLGLLQTHRYWPGGELADRLGVSVRTLRRDVDRLRELGYPVAAQRGVEGGYQLAPGAAMPPLVLDDEEAVALAVALLAAAQTSVAGVAESSVRALAKIVQVMPTRLRRRVTAVEAITDAASFSSPATAVDPGLLTIVAQACRDSVRLGFAYVAADGAASGRRVEPHRLVSLERHWYLVAHDLDRHDWRNFRLDRCADAVPSGIRFASRTLPAPDAAIFVRERLRHAPTEHELAAVVRAPAAVVIDRVGRWATVEPRSARTCRVTVHADSFEWAAMAFGVIGAAFTIDGSEEFATYLHEWGVRFVAATPAAG